MTISSQANIHRMDPAGISTDFRPGKSVPPKGPAPSPSVTFSKAPAGVGLTDGTDGIPPAALESALRRDDPLGKFVNAVLGA